MSDECSQFEVIASYLRYLMNRGRVLERSAKRHVEKAGAIKRYLAAWVHPQSETRSEALSRIQPATRGHRSRQRATSKAMVGSAWMCFSSNARRHGRLKCRRSYGDIPGAITDEIS